MLRSAVAALGVLGAVAAVQPLNAQSLRGSAHSLTVQNRQARAHDYTYLQSPRGIRHFVELGLLVRVPGNADYMLHRVSYPYARPEVKVFVQRLAREYRSACGEQLVVTSLVRPESMRLWNSSNRTVHPTGMAMDLRRSNRSSCRRWIERTLLSLERQGVLEATREHHPPHYHVAIFPHPYYQYLADIGENPRSRTASSTVALADDAAEDARADADDTDAGAGTLAAAGSGAGPSVGAGGPSDAAGTPQRTDATGAAAPLQADLIPHVVLRGETLWGIARRFGTTVAALLDVNGLDSPDIVAGQRLNVPGGDRAASQLAAASVTRYRVDSGDTLWSIARRHGTTVNALKRVNGLRGSRIKPGQVLTMPSER